MRFVDDIVIGLLGGLVIGCAMVLLAALASLVDGEFSVLWALWSLSAALVGFVCWAGLIWWDS